ncbi:alcohol dehydrogenase [Reticulibacter mediterranei]|uniref:Alcohol dehydrogenase n=1 Tax=Reticulibacter mediterranei TaxID=2778369 RepID=A0A8J3IQV1_9CHLR|nr:quinone oxidoreductase [Reticulibacter mediterranei]GHO95262.1 alcohol dehydrogenase [Reticulibacter mediterranei]
MKAIRIHNPGGPEVLTLEEVPTPQPGPGEARVKLAAAGVNFVDVYQRKGLYQINLPFIGGQEGSGVVDAVGDGVTEVKPGDKVAYTSVQASYAEYAIVPVARLIPVPDGVSLEDAAAAMLQGLTAHYLATSTYPLQPGDFALVHAAGGGVGQLLTQIAKKRGARVFGTVSTEEKAELARASGADEIIYYTREDFSEATRRFTDGKGAHVVYDSVGKDTFDKSLDSLRPRGYLVLYGQSSGPVAPVNPQILNAKGSLFLTRPTLVHYIATREELLQRTNELFSWIKEGTVKVRVDKTFPLSDAAEAHRYLEGRHTKGKVLLIP